MGQKVYYLAPKAKLMKIWTMHTAHWHMALTGAMHSATTKRKILTQHIMDIIIR